MNCAFIISPSYSGSTLLSMLLAHHPRLSTLGEFLDNQERRFRDGEGDYCSCGEKLAECPFMADLAASVHAKGIDFSVDFPDTAFIGADKLSKPVLRAYIRSPLFETARRVAIAALPGARDTIKRVVKRNSAVIGTLLEKAGASVYLDSAKNNNRVLFFDRYAEDIDVKTIWLIRDGRGVTNSIMRHSGHDVATSAKWWSITQESVIRTTKYLPAGNIMTLRYEDLCNHPQEWLSKACQFLGLDPSLLPESYGASGLHLTGNNMRLKGLGEIKPDEKWRATLTAADLAIFEKIGGRLNRELGYA